MPNLTDEEWNFNVDETEARIEDILAQTNAVLDAKLKPAHALIAEVKQALSKGVDLISTTQLQEWALAIPVICSELVPHKEVFNLTRDLWDIETKQTAAKNLLEYDMKKTDIDNINKVAGTTNAKKRAIADHIQARLGGMQEALWMLGNTVRKMLDVRIAGGDTK